MNEFERCLKDGRLVRFEATDAMIKKELDAAGYDLERAVVSLDEDDLKWASIKAYYSAFHSAKALVLKAGYREKGHYCLLTAWPMITGCALISGMKPTTG